MITNAQSDNKSYLNGFRLGITGEANVAPAMSLLPTGNGQSSLKAFPAIGGKVGIELSYHFANYFGVQIGLDFGTRMQYTLKEYDEAGNVRGRLQNQVGLWDFTIPVNMVFQYPISNNILLYSAAGVNLANVFHYPQDAIARQLWRTAKRPVTIY